jgi:type II secretory pathway pseudopilin PulG
MKSKANSRRGWTLMEMLVVIPLMALLLSASAALLTAVLRSQGMLWADIQQQSARARLATQLRTDAHGSSSAQSSSPQICDFLLESGETVHYEIKEASLHRELRRQDTAIEREKFPLNGLSAAFAVDESQQRPLVRLTLESVPEGLKYSRPARPSILEAAVGIQNSIAAGSVRP